MCSLEMLEISARKDELIMAVAIKNEQIKINQQKEIQPLVMAGLQQVTEGKTKDFNAVCDRLERKYLNETLQN